LSYSFILIEKMNYPPSRPGFAAADFVFDATATHASEAGCEVLGTLI